VKLLQKYTYWLVCTLILAGTVFFCSYRNEAPTLRFRVSSGAGAEEITLFEADDGSCYVFLPSYAHMDQVTIVMDAGQRASLNGTPLSSGMSCGGFAPETPYRLDMEGRDSADLWFYRSANVASVYIDTNSGSMEYIHRDKTHEEPISLTLYTADGSIDYSTGDGTIKGRGNATWNEEKRPYALTLPADADLLDMGAASKWILLANALDETNLRNKLVLDLAKQVDAPWSPGCAYADLYLNGEYSGLYLLTEKIEPGSGRLDINTDSGDFLCKFELNNRWSLLRHPFDTPLGRTVEITYPEDAASTGRIEALVNRLEQTVFSGTDLQADPGFDLDSWVRRYLIDEIAGNIDADLASSYFYYDDGTFYAGPVWDYDITFGSSSRNARPASFIAKIRHDKDLQGISYYLALYDNPSFYNRMTELYQSEFLPLLEQLTGGGIERMASEISAASGMNSIRWHSMFRSLYEENTILPSSADTLQEYLTVRTAFLSSAWLEGVKYCTVQFELPTGDYQSISLEHGSLLEAEGIDIHAKAWYHEDTGEPADLTVPVTGDMVLTQTPPEQEADQPLSGKQIFILVALLSLLAVLFLVFLLMKV